MLIETGIKLAAKILIVLVGCIACLLCILPLYGSYNYTIGGICTGIVVAVVLTWHLTVAEYVNALTNPTVSIFAVVVGGAIVVGVFWPVTVVAGLWLWLKKSGGWGGGGPARPAAA